MKSTRYLLAAPAVLALALAGCGGSTGNSETPAASGSSAAGAPADDSNCGDAAVYCVGLVTDTGKVDDKSFNQSAHEGAMAAAEQTKGFYKYIETQDAKDYAANMHAVHEQEVRHDRHRRLPHDRRDRRGGRGTPRPASSGSTRATTRRRSPPRTSPASSSPRTRRATAPATSPA